MLNCSIFADEIKTEILEQIDNLQIGHSHNRKNDFIVEREVRHNPDVEVSFSHRHDFYAIYWIHSGKGMHIIDFEDIEIKPERVFFLKLEQIHFMNISSDICYSALQFTDDYLLSTNPLSLIEQSERIPTFIDMTAEESKRLQILFGQICNESNSQLQMKGQIIKAEINLLLLELERMGKTLSTNDNIPEIVKRFRDMVDKKYLKLRKVQEYSRELGVTANYLNVLVQKHTGHTALSVINGRIMLEIKRLLVSTQDDISTIAYHLGFNELSYFSRFFKRETGFTPNEFRMKMNEMYQ